MNKKERGERKSTQEEAKPAESLSPIQEAMQEGEGFLHKGRRRAPPSD